MPSNKVLRATQRYADRFQRADEIDSETERRYSNKPKPKRLRKQIEMSRRGGSIQEMRSQRTMLLGYGKPEDVKEADRIQEEVLRDRRMKHKEK